MVYVRQSPKPVGQLGAMKRSTPKLELRSSGTRGLLTLNTRTRQADSTLLLEAVRLHQQRLGRAPELLAGDAGF